MRVHVLGKFELHSGATLVPVPVGMVGKLLRALLVRPNAPLDANHLCRLLWPTQAPEGVKSRLHVVVSRLRRFLVAHGGADDRSPLRVDRAGSGYRLVVSADSLDRLEFEELAEKAMGEGAPGAVQRALRVWGGEPYAEFEWTSEVRTQRNRLLDLHRRLLAIAVTDRARPQASSGRKVGAPPLPHGSLLRRSRLLDAAPDVGDATVLAAVAPAGFGKSVFLAQWTQQQQVPTAWLTLDAQDNDPARFWSGVVDAIAESNRSRLSWDGGRLDAVSRAPAAAITEMLMAGGAPPAVVLDDFHVVTNPTVHEQVAALVPTLPTESVIAFGTRAELPFATAPLMASGHLHRVTATDLRMTVDEVEALVQDRAQARWLSRVTEGWPVAVMSLRQLDPDDSDVVDVLEVMSDYVADEVLDAVPPQVADFMMEIAHLDQFNESLCETATERHDAGELLTWLRRHQFFVTETGADGLGWRMHRLVSAELRHRAETAGDVEPTRIIGRAARWFLALARPEQSLRHAIRAHEPRLVAEAASEVLTHAILEQDAVRCRHWLDLLDPEHLAADARAHSIGTFLALVLGPPAERRSWTQSRRRHFGPDDLLVLFHDGVVATQQGQSSEAEARLERVVSDVEAYGAEVVPDLVPTLAAQALVHLVAARMLRGVLRSDDELFSAVVGRVRPLVPAMAAAVQSNWALVALVDGSYERASLLVEESYRGRRLIDAVRRPTPENSLAGALVAAHGTRSPASYRSLAQGIEDLVELYGAMGYDTWVVLARLVIAALYRKGGDLGRAARHQRRADALMVTFCDAPFLDRFSSSVDGIVAGRLDGGQRPVDLLTPRERVVFPYLVSELSQQEIAKALDLSVNTIRKHVASIYRKFGVRSRHGVVLRACVDDLDFSAPLRHLD